jgi:hypothetical protein
MSDDGKPLEILPWGRSLEDMEKIDRKKAAGKRGGFGCLLMAFAFALLCVFAWGWSVGYSGSCKPIGNESALSVVHRNATEQRK